MTLDLVDRFAIHAILELYPNTRPVGLGDDVVDDVAQVVAPVPDRQLAVGAGAVLEDPVDVVHLLALPSSRTSSATKASSSWISDTVSTSSCLPKSISLPEMP